MALVEAGDGAHSYFSVYFNGMYLVRGLGSSCENYALLHMFLFSR